jgi:hypothetical protein
MDAAELSQEKASFEARKRECPLIHPTSPSKAHWDARRVLYLGFGMARIYIYIYHAFECRATGTCFGTHILTHPTPRPQTFNPRP